ncbi:MAG: restriction endonuclease subunit S [Actinomycetota bacterium]|nr:restriction endonuclease subunit S [Actinomycetota bacterium]MDA2988773.1 restriction endonuclease subunit S [Actinomycetota bacterium]MDA3029466.1 restriction endonuclease subunit S [Actinomycetota bacterium]
MSEDWVEVRLGDVAQAHKTVVNPARLGSLIVDHYSLPAFDNGKRPERVPAETIKSNKLNVPPGSVLVSRLNPHIPRIWTPRVDPDTPSMCSTEFAVLLPTACEPEFLRYFVESDEIYGRLGESVNGTSSSHQRVSLDHLLDMRAPMPPSGDQRRIAEVLSALDDRIESAARLEKVLGETVLAEYRLALLDRAEEEVVSLVDAVSLINGGAYTKGADGSGRMVIRIKELNSGPSESTVYSSITVPDNKTAYPGDVLFAWSGSLGVWRWYRDEAIVNQHIFKVLPKKHPVWMGWIHILEELERFQDIAAGKATTMGHITKDHLERTMVPIFSAEELEALSSRVEPLWDAQLQAGRELHTLQAVRAQLLPALVSGELRVAAAEELVEAST